MKALPSAARIARLDPEHAAEETLGDLAAGDVVLGLARRCRTPRPSARSAGCAAARRTSPARSWSGRRPGRRPPARSRARTAPARPGTRGRRAARRIAGVTPRRIEPLDDRAEAEGDEQGHDDQHDHRAGPEDQAAEPPGQQGTGGQHEAGDERVVAPGAARAARRRARRERRGPGPARSWCARLRRFVERRAEGPRVRTGLPGARLPAWGLARTQDPPRQLSSSLPNPATTSRSADSCAVIESRRRVRRSTSALSAWQLALGVGVAAVAQCVGLLLGRADDLLGLATRTADQLRRPPARTAPGGRWPRRWLRGPAARRRSRAPRPRRPGAGSPPTAESWCSAASRVRRSFSTASSRRASWTSRSAAARACSASRAVLVRRALVSCSAASRCCSASRLAPARWSSASASARERWASMSASGAAAGLLELADLYDAHVLGVRLGL